MLEARDDVGGIEADADVLAFQARDEFDEVGGGDLLVRLERQGDAGRLVRGQGLPEHLFRFWLRRL